MERAQRTPENAGDATWADLSGRRFFAWRMAAACEGALREVHLAMARQSNQSRLQAMEQASLLLRKELHRWVQRGEALDVVLQRLPQPPE